MVYLWWTLTNIVSLGERNLGSCTAPLLPPQLTHNGWHTQPTQSGTEANRHRRFPLSLWTRLPFRVQPTLVTPSRSFLLSFQVFRNLHGLET
jgi:hypothetical protein